jgi:hypothetical protein
MRGSEDGFIAGAELRDSDAAVRPNAPYWRRDALVAWFAKATIAMAGVRPNAPYWGRDALVA